ncbi:flagellar basal-body rod protein FlgB [Candidatus Epulonipiscioides gigas]|nr:flagellar basal-body rod protein FlgB [Epulopiscium sp. SCG-C07WGA-EpuloA2]
MLRYQQLTNNIANIDTVGYKRMDVAFENILAAELDKSGASGIDLDNINPQIYYDNASTTMRLDGNNVDIDIEMSELSKEKIRYDTLIQKATSQVQRYQNIFQQIQ